MAQISTPKLYPSGMLTAHKIPISPIESSFLNCVVASSCTEGSLEWTACAIAGKPSRHQESQIRTQQMECHHVTHTRRRRRETHRGASSGDFPRTWPCACPSSGPRGGGGSPPRPPSACSCPFASAPARSAGATSRRNTRRTRRRRAVCGH
uniref:Uncharacterized protein n=1 Tax=Zea mays TaxID=4577 RepID=C0P7N9_MAIZE|nr:unknown [Zea mays]